MSTGRYRGGFSGGPQKLRKNRKIQHFAITFDRVELLGWNFYWIWSVIGQNFGHVKFGKIFRNSSKIRNWKFEIGQLWHSIFFGGPNVVEADPHQKNPWSLDLTCTTVQQMKKSWKHLSRDYAGLIGFDERWKIV